MLEAMNLDDFTYLDPPYEMTRSTGKYFGKIDYNDLFDRVAMMNERGIKYAMSFDSTDENVVVPGDCYENCVDISTRNWGYRQIRQRMDNSNVYEKLYVN